MTEILICTLGMIGVVVCVCFVINTKRYMEEESFCDHISEDIDVLESNKNYR